MGSELLERPLWETLHTVKSVLSFWMVVAVVLFIVGFVLVSIKIVNRQQITDNRLRAKFAISPNVVLLVLMLISIPLFFILKPNQDANSVNKLWYCLGSCFSKESDELSIEFDSEIINKYKDSFPEREVIDDHYPLERVDGNNNVLGPYFERRNVKPDIVFVIMESLGSDFFGQNKLGYTVTPFLDSLSKHSLLWTNCLSTTPRSVGVLPATTASVPHGPKGFQFGDMPEHNSLFSILKHNSYNTNVFYAGNFAFDRVYDYLAIQEIDYISPFAYECSQNKNSNTFDYSSWGYHDMKLYERGLSIISKRKDSNPDFDVFITISQHDNGLKLNTNKELQDYYYSKAEEILSTIPTDKKKGLQSRKGFMAAFLYGDDALKQFFKEYNTKRKDDNVIFVITGDHSLNISYNNPLNAYHVPLIIWSPLLKETQHFYSVVSHNDITPSLTTLLKENFELNTPKNIHWVSDGLDTAVSFRSNLKTYFIAPSNQTTNCLYDSIFYIEKDGEDFLYLVQDGLQLEKIRNDSLLNLMKERMSMMLYIDNYTYTNNKLTQTPIIQPKNYELLESITIDSVICRTGEEKPSIVAPPIVDLYSTTIAAKYSEIKVVITADMKYTADITYDKFILLAIKSSNAIWMPEVISKNINEKNYKPEQWCSVNATKILKTKNKKKDSEIKIYLRPSEHDHMWNPEHSVLLKDINIKIFGVK
ncbi:MAG: sulfatase-like hydrolase/transferase [Bacteroidales bacterium]|nr:sulfatase-like hydrolase/transferase [Bacteroidales bacterium]